MKYPFLFLVVIIGLNFLGCGHTSNFIEEHDQRSKSVINYSVIYYIHGDSDYSYHSPDGKLIQGNSIVISTAMKVGEAAYSGEVLIIHHRSERKLFGIFPRKNSRLYHYSNGQRINKIKFRHSDKVEEYLTTEAKLIRKYRIQNRASDHRNYLLYFGHEIPIANGEGYHRTLPGVEVNLVSFSTGIQKLLTTEDDRFELVVLSTCNNGTPRVAELLLPFTDTLLASPQNLHLSHIDSSSLLELEKEPNISHVQLARNLAEETYHRLRKTIHTTITLAVYNLEYVQGYIESLTARTSINKPSNTYEKNTANIDCLDGAELNSELFGRGVESWYKPARFGIQTGRDIHSGWGCKPIQPTTSNLAD